MKNKEALQTVLEALELLELRNQSVIANFGQWMPKYELESLRAEQKALNKEIYEGYELMAKENGIAKGVEFI